MLSAVLMLPVEPCSHRPPCPGCPRYGEPGIDLLAGARLADLASRLGCEPPVELVGAQFGFRVRARLMVRGRAASPKIGIFQAGSHRIADIPRCRVHHPRINEVAAAARAAIRATGVRPYAERSHTGDLRAIQVVIERSTGTAQVVLIANASEPAPLATLATELTERLGPMLHSLWWNGQPERSNVLIGPHWHCWQLGSSADSAGSLRESIGGADVFFPPGAFGQSHLDLADRIVERIHAWVPDGSAVTELYAGCGSIGLGLLARCPRVCFVESSPEAVRGLAMGLAASTPAERARAHVRQEPVQDAIDALRGAEVVIADPPRKGLDAPMLEALCGEPPRRFVYLSCDVDSLERDAERLVASRRLRLAELVACDLFPNTHHVETLARFERCEST